MFLILDHFLKGPVQIATAPSIRLRLPDPRLARPTISGVDVVACIGHIVDEEIHVGGVLTIFSQRVEVL